MKNLKNILTEEEKMEVCDETDRNIEEMEDDIHYDYYPWCTICGEHYDDCDCECDD